MITPSARDPATEPVSVEVPAADTASVSSDASSVGNMKKSSGGVAAAGGSVWRRHWKLIVGIIVGVVLLCGLGIGLGVYFGAVAKHSSSTSSSSSASVLYTTEEVSRQYAYPNYMVLNSSVATRAGLWENSKEVTECDLTYFESSHDYMEWSKVQSGQYKDDLLAMAKAQACFNNNQVTNTSSTQNWMVKSVDGTSATTVTTDGTAVSTASKASPLFSSILSYSTSSADAVGVRIGTTSANVCYDQRAATFFDISSADDWLSFTAKTPSCTSFKDMTIYSSSQHYNNFYVPGEVWVVATIVLNDGTEVKQLWSQNSLKVNTASVRTITVETVSLFCTSMSIYPYGMYDNGEQYFATCNWIHSPSLLFNIQASASCSSFTAATDLLVGSTDDTALCVI